MKRISQKTVAGFVLLELMIVIALTGVLASIALPEYMSYKDRAVKAVCVLNRRDIEILALAHRAEYDELDSQLINAGTCPGGGVYVWQSTDPGDPGYGKPLCSLHSFASVDAGAPQYQVPVGDNIAGNSDFESLGKYPKKKGWTYINSNKVDGWSAAKNSMEVWADGMLGVNAPQGDYFIELDTKKSVADKIYQEVPTEAGRVYEITLKARARKKGTSDLVVSWGGEDAQTITPEVGTWTDYTIKVVGTGDPMELSLSELKGQNDGYGPLLDGISITATDEFSGS